MLNSNFIVANQNASDFIDNNIILEFPPLQPCFLAKPCAPCALTFEIINTTSAMDLMNLILIFYYMKTLRKHHCPSHFNPLTD